MFSKSRKKCQNGGKKSDLFCEDPERNWPFLYIRGGDFSRKKIFFSKKFFFETFFVRPLWGGTIISSARLNRLSWSLDRYFLMRAKRLCLEHFVSESCLVTLWVFLIQFVLFSLWNVLSLLIYFKFVQCSTQTASVVSCFQLSLPCVETMYGMETGFWYQ